jgi:amino acid transporter
MPEDKSIAEQMRTWIGDSLIPHRHTSLLVAIIILLGVRALVGGTGVGAATYSILVMLVLMVAVYTIQVDELLRDRELLVQQRKKRGFVGWVLAIVAIVLRLSLFASPSHKLAMASSLSLVLFFGFVALTELRAVLRQRTVTRETISMSISVYLLFGLTWGFFYIVLFEFQPNAFSFGGAPTPSELQITPVLIYFSLTTIATVGYGDITPLTLQARYAAVAEGIAGQFYLAILVARLVGMQMSQSASQPPEPRTNDHATKQSSAKD